MSLQVRSARVLRAVNVCPHSYICYILYLIYNILPPPPPSPLLLLLYSTDNSQLALPLLRPIPTARRHASTSTEKDLKETLKAVIPEKRELLKKFKAEHGHKTLCEVKVENAIGGMRFALSLSFSPPPS